MFVLIYGPDGTGKSVQCKAVAEISENPIHLSFATKNRKLYETSDCQSTELLSFNEDVTVNPYKTMDNFHDQVSKIIKENVMKLVILDEITLLRKWAQPVVLEKINRARRAKNDYPIERIGRDNAAAWGWVNDLVYGELERLSNWATINDATVLAITAVTEERQLITDSDNKKVSETTGRWICDAKTNIRKLADVIIKLEKDGSKGKGYWMIFEKQQDWMTEGKDSVKVDKTGMMAEFMTRGILT